jgi:TfoX/Sxy family transcriptional regulator of competence genes
MRGAAVPTRGAAQYDAVAQALTAATAAVAGKMFGMPSLLIHGKAFAGLYKGSMVFKLDGEAHARALALGGSRLFDPSWRGRPMKAWLQVPATHAGVWRELARHALRFVSAER